MCCAVYVLCEMASAAAQTTHYNNTFSENENKNIFYIGEIETKLPHPH